MGFKNYNMGLLSKYWTPEQGKEYIIEIVGNEYVKEEFRKENRTELKDVMIYKVSAVQEIGTNIVSTFETPKEWKTASTKVHLFIQEMINQALLENKDTIRVQIRRDTDNKFSVFKWTMPKF